MAKVTHQIQISGPQLSGTFVLSIGATTIGRQDTNDLVFVHPLVSRQHARLDCTVEICQITDLGSTHGTTVNRLQLAAHTPLTLNAGDVIEIGAFRLVYEQVVAAEETAEPTPIPSVEEKEDETAVPTADPQDIKTWGTSEYAPITVPLPPPPPQPNGKFTAPPGLSLTESSYLEYLPDIYRGNNNFITRFLALLESILAPIEWNIDNFDLYLDPGTAPAAFLPWLANWYELIFNETWSEEKRRVLLAEAHQIYNRRGTVWALCRVLEIYTGSTPEIDDHNKNLDPFTFSVRIPLREREANRIVIEQLIDANKPAHTNYTLMFKE